MCGIKPSQTVTRERLPNFNPLFLMSSRLLTLTTQGGTPLSMGPHARCQGLVLSFLTCLWLRRVTFIATPMFLRIWRSGPFRVTTRLYVLLFKNRLFGNTKANAFGVVCPTIPSSVLFLKRLDDDHQYLADPSGWCTRRIFKHIVEKARRQTVRELSRKTPDSLGAKLLTASTLPRAYRNGHLGTLKPVGKCVDPISFEFSDFQELSQILSNLTRESLAERHPWTQTEKDNALAKCRLGLRAWRVKKTVHCLHAVTDDDGHPLEDEDESGRKLCEYWGSSFQARAEGPRHHQFENLLQYVQEAPDEIRMVIDRMILTNSWLERRNLLLALPLAGMHLFQTDDGQHL